MSCFPVTKNVNGNRQIKSHAKWKLVAQQNSLYCTFHFLQDLRNSASSPSTDFLVFPTNFPTAQTVSCLIQRLKSVLALIPHPISLYSEPLSFFSKFSHSFSSLTQWCLRKKHSVLAVTWSPSTWCFLRQSLKDMELIISHVCVFQ